MKLFNDIFRKGKEQEAQPLKMDGIAPAPLTFAPDDAELAAQALMETMMEMNGSGFITRKIQAAARKEDAKPEEGTVAYYRKLSERIRTAHRESCMRTARFLTFCEHELKNPNLPMEGDGSLGLLEAELYKRIDTVEREGGELKRRWQHCLAEVTVRLMGIQ